ncbi:GNAT family N-acetyltransferase [Streptomyces sp. NPDC088254]|uniref:GNAT family N-acetyltransferase n=1 Tax=Streptomyces sp. NPDC088254 TaxID=3365847 RepID=UPI00380F2A89
MWRARLDDPVPGAALFLAVEAGRLLGFVHLEPKPDGRILLDSLHVRPGDSGRGLGRLPLGRALAWAAAAHPGRDVYLEVLQDDTRAVAFYERHGGHRTASRVCRFDQSFELPEFEYTWPAGAAGPLDDGLPAERGR